MEKAPERAYLLRCWQEDGQWRFSIETIGRRRQRVGFRSLEDLVAFLRSQLSNHGEGPATSSHPG